MLDDVRRQIERQLDRLLEEAERPMTIEEMIPHLDPVLPGPNDLADVLEAMRQRAKDAVEREGSYWRKATPVPLGSIFPAQSTPNAEVVVDLLRELDAEGDGAPYPTLVARARERGVPPDRVLDVVTRLKHAGEVYEASGRRLRLTKR